MKRVSKDGVITVEEAKGTDTYIARSISMQFDDNPFHFVTNAEDLTAE